MGVQNPNEQYGGKVEEQIDMTRKALNYPGRFAPPQEPQGQDADRWSNVERGSGAKQQ